MPMPKNIIILIRKKKSSSNGMNEPVENERQIIKYNHCMVIIARAIAWIVSIIRFMLINAVATETGSKHLPMH